METLILPHHLTSCTASCKSTKFKIGDRVVVKGDPTTPQDYLG